MSKPEPDDTHGDPARRFRLAHVSDPHLTSLDGVHWHELLNKRLIGWVSWHLKRRHRHRFDLLESLERDLRRHRPDHIAVTGDLTQVGTPSECRQAKSWLEQLGSPESVTTIPGNHDCYAPANWNDTIGLWADYMHGDDDSLFPSLKTRGPIALIGLTTGLPTAPFMASGRLGQNQLQRLERLLEQTAEQGLCRIVLLHHGPVPGTYSWRRSLRDGERLCEILQRKGAEAVLHGHGHRRVRNSIQGQAAAIPVIGATSASYYSTEPEKIAAYNLYDIVADGSGWRLTMMPRIYDVNADLFADGEAVSFQLGGRTAVTG